MRMKSTWLIHVIVMLTLPVAAVRAEDAPPPARVGDAYELILSTQSEQKSSTGSSGRSGGKDALVERVIGVRADGLELLYDLPANVPAEQRARVWQFPARVFKPLQGAPQLLNGAELEARLEVWLKAAGVERSACGHWIFTWTAIRIECDPMSVLTNIQAFDLGPGHLREGERYQVGESGTSGRLKKTAGGAGGETFTVDMPIDEDAVRRARAESDRVVGEIMKSPVTLEAALEKHAGDTVTGTVTITLDTDRAGQVRRRTRVTQMEVKDSEGHIESQTLSETLERRRVAGRE